MPRRKPIIVIQGAQWGSEAKGAATAAIGQHRGASVYVRTGTVNAGHTVYKDGAAYKMQQLPVGWVDPNATLVIGAGAYIHPEILMNEINMINRATGLDIRERLLIDRNCGIHVSTHTKRSEESGRHHSMGATGKGCSEAVIDKIKNRGTEMNALFRNYVPFFSDHPGFTNLTECIIDTSTYLNDQYEMGRQIIIEGTQGSHLDLHLGPYPYTTHKQTQAANWAAECGLGLGAEWEVVLVVRTCPIRVAGNSGPMPLETSWPTLAEMMNRKLSKRGLGPVVEPDAIQVWQDMCQSVTKEYWPEYTGYSLSQGGFQFTSYRLISTGQEFLSEMHKRAFDNLDMATQTELQKLFEFTTVTKKLRRVATFHAPTVLEAIRWNRPKYLALTFLNYWEPQLSHRTQFEQDDVESVMHNIQQGEEMLGVPIEYFNVGPFNEHFFQVPAVAKTYHPRHRSVPIL